MIQISGALAIEALGVEGDWDFNSLGNVFWNESIPPVGGLVFDGPPEGEYAELTGCAEEAFNAAVPGSANCVVTLYNYSDAGTIAVSIKGGAPVDFEFENGGGEVTRAVEAGSGSGLRLTCGNTLTQTIINRIRVLA